MGNQSNVSPDVLAIAVALCSNPEAFKQATTMVEHECRIRTDPVAKISEWAIAIAGTLAKAKL